MICNCKTYFIKGGIDKLARLLIEDCDNDYRVSLCNYITGRIIKGHSFWISKEGNIEDLLRKKYQEYFIIISSKEEYKLLINSL